jgi:hypothetical protein
MNPYGTLTDKPDFPRVIYPPLSMIIVGPRMKKKENVMTSWTVP